MKKPENKRKNRKATLRIIKRIVVYWLVIACIALLLNGVLPGMYITINWVKCFFALALVRFFDLTFDWEQFKNREEEP